MTTNLKSVLTGTVADHFINHVASHLSTWLKENKDVDITPEEISEAFDIPYTPKPTFAGLPQAGNIQTQMPNFPRHHGVSPSKKSERKKKAQAADPNVPRCIYRFQRGRKEGTVCGEPVAQTNEPGGDKYCRTCIKKKTVTNILERKNNSVDTVKAPEIPNNAVPAVDVEPDNDENTISAIPIPGHEGMYKDVNNGFILKEYEGGTIVALAMEENGVQRPLTADERAKAQYLGMSLLDSPTPDQQGPMVPMIPTIPGISDDSMDVPTIPTIPTL